MQRRLVEEDIAQKRRGRIAVQHGAGTGDIVERAVAFKYDQSAGLGARENRACVADVADGLGDGGLGIEVSLIIHKILERFVPAEALERLTYLGLKYDNDQYYRYLKQ